jgi:hypothetical protein
MGVNEQRKTEASSHTETTRTKKKSKRKSLDHNKGNTNRLPSSDTTIFCTLSIPSPARHSCFLVGRFQHGWRQQAASPHCASTVREEATPWRGAAEAAPAGDAGGDVAPCAWPWPWP